MISFYLENIFYITVIAVGLAVTIPIMGILILRNRGSSIKEKPNIKELLVQTSLGLLMAGLVIPILIAFLIKINPNFVEDNAPYAGYSILFLIILLIFINVRRFKFIANKNLIQLKTNDKKSNNEEQVVSLDKKIHEYRFHMITIIISIVYLAILFNLRAS